MLTPSSKWLDWAREHDTIAAADERHAAVQRQRADDLAAAASAEVDPVIARDLRGQSDYARTCARRFTLWARLERAMAARCRLDGEAAGTRHDPFSLSLVLESPEGRMIVGGGR